MFSEDTKKLGSIRPKFAEKDSQTFQQDLKQYLEMLQRLVNVP